jgi:hypothetical protein
VTSLYFLGMWVSFGSIEAFPRAALCLQVSFLFFSAGEGSWTDR